MDDLLPEVIDAPLTREGEVRDQLAALRDDLYARAVRGLHGILRWSEVDPAADTLPEGWLEEYGYDEKRAWSAFRMAQAAHQSTRDAPAGLKLTVDLYRGLETARAQEQIGVPRVAVQVNIGAPPPALPEKVVEKDVDDG